MSSLLVTLTRGCYSVTFSSYQILEKRFARSLAVLASTGRPPHVKQRVGRHGSIAIIRVHLCTVLHKIDVEFIAGHNAGLNGGVQIIRVARLPAPQLSPRVTACLFRLANNFGGGDYTLVSFR